MDLNRAYEILMIPHDADLDDVKKAFRDEARIVHPDQYANVSEAVRARAEEKFKLLNEAYQFILSYYDRKVDAEEQQRMEAESRELAEKEAAARAKAEREKQRVLEEQQRREEFEREKELEESKLRWKVAQESRNLKSERDFSVVKKPNHRFAISWSIGVVLIAYALLTNGGVPLLSLGIAMGLIAIISRGKLPLWVVFVLSIGCALIASAIREIM
ncbi:MAG: J domain-containing protein [bacterium]|nr:J domain-containing protein [bacterium]